MLRTCVNLRPRTGSGHKGLSECACYRNFLCINISHLSSVVSNALVMGEKEQTSKYLLTSQFFLNFFKLIGYTADLQTSKYT
jgi:hypothetical protein